jgi:hypothetical protein
LQQRADVLGAFGTTIAAKQAGGSFGLLRRLGVHHRHNARLGSRLDARLGAGRRLSRAVARFGRFHRRQLFLRHDPGILEQSFEDRPAFEVGKAIDEFAIAKIALPQPLQQDLCICPHSANPSVISAEVLQTMVNKCLPASPRTPETAGICGVLQRSPNLTVLNR